jgi:hypothetical protein
VPLFAPYIGALIGSLLYLVFIGFHIIDEPLLPIISIPMVNVTEYPLIKKASLAEFDEDNLDEESVEGYTDKIYVDGERKMYLT